MASYYLGVDGGQSSTEALIADETGRIIGSGTAGPCDHVSEELAAAKLNAVMIACLRDACSQAGLSFPNVHFAGACLGFSGGAVDKEATLRPLINSSRYKFTHDAEIALVGATEGRSGIIVIAGTGSMSFGRDAMGRTARAGGWGYIFGDEGGAFDLVRKALRAALQFEEGWGARTVLLPLLLEATGAASANELLHVFYSAAFPRSRVAALAPLVDQAVIERDAVANQIVDKAGSELARLVEGVHANLFSAGESVPVAPIGGAFSCQALSINFSRYVRQSIACDVMAPRFSPAAGAVLEALALDGNKSRLTEFTSLEN